MALKLMGKKRGMVQLFDENGNAVPCTVIEAEPNVITQIKTIEADGYNAIQIGFEKVEAKDPRRQEKRTKKPQRGHFKKAGIEPRRHLKEFRIDDVSEYALGQEIGVTAFKEVSFVDAIGVSNGKGFQGTMKKFHFRGGRATHGSKFHRAPGSIGMRSTPGKVAKNKKMPGHLGAKRVTAQNLKVIMVREEDNLLIVEGQVPGPKNGLVTIQSAKKKQKNG